MKQPLSVIGLTALLAAIPAYAATINTTTTPPDEFDGVRTDYLQLSNSSSEIGTGSISLGNANVTGDGSIGSGSAFVSGNYSIGFGDSGLGGGGASGNYSVALGIAAVASGDSSMATGWSSARGHLSFATGSSSALGDQSVALGNGGAYGNYSFVSGFGCFAVGRDTAVFGKWNDVDQPEGANLYQWAAGLPANDLNPSDHLFVIGNGTDNNNRSNAMVIYHNGDTDLNGDVTVQGELRGSTPGGSIGLNGSVFINGDAGVVEISSSYGTDVTAGGLSVEGSPVLTAQNFSVKNSGNSVSWGDFPSVTGALNTAWGVGTHTANYSSTAWGEGASATGYASTAWGRSTKAEGNFSTALGNNTVATEADSLAVGKYNDSTSNALFSVGNGTSTARSNAFEVHRNGDATILGDLALGGDLVVNRDIRSVLPNSSTISTLDSILMSSPTGDVVISSATGTWVNGDVNLNAGMTVFGATVINGDTELKGKVVMSEPQGDVSMGIYGN